MENFALFDLLRALGGINAAKGGENDGDEKGAKTPPPAQEKAADDGQHVNVLASLIERHDAISNRIKNRRK